MISAYENLSKEELLTELVSAKSCILQLRTELDQLKRLIFGTKSERFVPAVPTAQPSLGFDIQAAEFSTAYAL